ncbi:MULTISPECIES: GNAT family N-acetyltransferase [Cobetia]|nr:MULTISPECIES: GNAT family N-acetyltransferase [Cobetia]
MNRMAGVLRELVLDDATLAALLVIEASQPHGMSKYQLVGVLSDTTRCVLGVYLPATAQQAELLTGFVVVARGPFEAEVEAITVHAEQRGRGIGQQLLKGALLRAGDWHRESGLERLLLEVRADNVSARALYVRAGFCEDGIRKRYYPATDGRREDAVLMSCPLS